MDQHSNQLSGDSNMNNLNIESPKSTPPDLIRNLPYPEEETKSSFQKDLLKENEFPYPIKAPGQLYSVENSKPGSHHKRKRKFTRGLCYLAWIFCLPVMAIGVCVRDQPEDEDDLHNDPCLPCYYSGRTQAERDAHS